MKMNRAGATLVVLAACLLFTSRSFCQDGPALRGYASVVSRTVSAKESFNAIHGANRWSVIMGGGEVVDIWRDLFVNVGISQLSLAGERVVVSGDEVFRLGIPVETTIRPVDFGAGWKLHRSRLSPYVGAGATLFTYRETSAFATDEENVDDRRLGPMVFGGLDYDLTRWLHVGGEFRYRRVSEVLGMGGVSKVFDEKGLASVDVGLRLSIGR